MEKNENTGQEQSPVLKDNIFLRKVKTEVEHSRQLPEESIARLKKIFSRKNFKGIEKCCYEVVIALGMSGIAELKILAMEFNTILNNSCR